MFVLPVSNVYSNKGNSSARKREAFCIFSIIMQKDGGKNKHHYFQYSCQVLMLLKSPTAKDNLTTRIIEVHGQPHLCFFAKKKIEIGDELLYSCGERRRIILQENPWLLS